MTNKKKTDSRYLLCDNCGEPIFGGQSWEHDAREDKNYHLHCYLGNEGRVTGEK